MNCIHLSQRVRRKKTSEDFYLCFSDDDNDDPDIEKISLSESVKNYYDSDDDPTGEYEGDLDTSKFNEEGSFIGLYGAKTAKEATV
jgi:hypothetical protein